MRKFIRYIALICVFILSIQGVMAQSLRIMSYNCRMSGELTNYSVTPFAALIKQKNPDVILLQEVDFLTKRNKNQDFTTQLAAELGMFSVFGKAIETGGGEYGVAILSKYPFLNVKNAPFVDIDGVKEIRTLLYIDIEMPETQKKVRIACTHLDHSTDVVRSAMVAQINERLGNAEIPTILAGDFNARHNSVPIVEGMKDWQKICDNTFTYPAVSATIKIDYIFGLPKGKWEVKSFEALGDEGLSDHKALITDVEFKK